MKTTLFLIGLYVTFGFFACKKTNSDAVNWTNRITELDEHNKAKITIGEGLWGTMTMKDGNCMPIVPKEGGTCKEYPVVRRVMIYEPTLPAQAPDSMSVFFPYISTKMLASTTSDGEGFYQLSLAPGIYSLFIEQNNVPYANGGGTYIGEVEVKTGRVTKAYHKLNFAVY